MKTKRKNMLTTSFGISKPEHSLRLLYRSIYIYNLKRFSNPNVNFLTSPLLSTQSVHTPLSPPAKNRGPNPSSSTHSTHYPYPNPYHHRPVSPLPESLTQLQTARHVLSAEKPVCKMLPCPPYHHSHFTIDLRAPLSY